MPPGELQIRVNGLEDLIPGRSDNGGKGKTMDSVRGSHVGTVGSSSRGGGGGGSPGGRGGGDGERSGGRGDGGVPTDGARGQNGIFANMRVLVAYSTPSRDQIAQWITEKGGSVLSPMHYKSCTHICLGEEDTDTGEAYVWLRDEKKIINKCWVKQAYDTNNIHDTENAPCCSDQTDGRQRTNFRSEKVKRTLCFDQKQEEIIMSNHQLFLCKADRSTRMSMTVYVQAMKKTLVNSVITPGSFPIHHSNTTNPEIKAAIKEAYVLLKSLNRAGYSLCGQFSSSNFVLDKGKSQLNVRFAGIDADALKESDPDREELDIQGLKKMVRRQIFQNTMVPHDMNLWLFLIGKKECEDLIPHHVYLLDYPEWTEPFMTWYDTWGNLKPTHIKTYNQILDALQVTSLIMLSKNVTSLV